MIRNTYFLFLLGLVLLSTSCGDKKETTLPETRDLTEAVYASGNLYPANEYKLFSNAEGTLLERLVESGDSVEPGDRLFVLDRGVDFSRLEAAKKALELARSNAGSSSPLLSELRAALKTAEEKYRLDSLNYTRYKDLFHKEAIDKKTFEQFQLGFEASRNELQSRRENYRRTSEQVQVELAQAQSNYEALLDAYDEHVPLSRIRGRVYELFKEEGESVHPGELLAILGSYDSMEVRLNVDELDISRVKPGQEVLIRFDIDQQEVYKGRITRIYPRLNKVDQSFRVDAEFTGKRPPSLYGLTLEANIVIGHRSQVLCIPRSLLLSGDSVMVKQNGEAVKVKVETGTMDWDFVEIRDGLDASTELIKR